MLSEPRSSLASDGRPWHCRLRIVATFLCIFGFARDGQSQPPSANHASSLRPIAVTMRDDASLSSVFFVEPAIGWAVGDRGAIWHTVDGGETWLPQSSPVDGNLHAVYFLDAARGWAVGGVHKPFSRSTSGIVLRTIDGGATWSIAVPAERGTIPLLVGVRFFDARRGIAFGDSGPMMPAGVFATLDGGNSWQSLACSGAGSWLAGDFIAPDAGAVAGSNGQFATIANTQVTDSPQASGSLRSLRAMQLSAPTSGWLVGDGGFVAATNDLGRSWQAPPRELPPQVGEHFDFQAVAVVGAQVWIAGAPGSLVFHSADKGHSWDAFPTGQTTPLRSIAFIDETHGWAVGDLGVILATRDGGRSWQTQHRGGKRTALLGVFADPCDVPLEVLAQQGAAEGYLTAVEFPLRATPFETALGLPTSNEPATERRARTAMLLAGATSADTAWRFPLPREHALLTRDQLVAELDRTNDGRTAELLASRLVRQIRMWRPEVLLTHHTTDAPGGASAARSLVERAILLAVNAAADETQYTELSSAGLEPWRVKRVYGVLPAGTQGQESVATAQFSPLLGETLRDWSAGARRLLSNADASPPDVVELSLVANANPVPTRDPESADGRGLFRGIPLPPGGDARRKTSALPAGDVDQLRRMAARRRNLEELLERGQGNPAWAAQVVQLTANLNAESGGEIYFQLADGYRLKGKLDLAADTYYLLARTYPDHPLTEQALRWLTQFYASSEAAVRLAQAGRGAELQRQTSELASDEVSGDGIRQVSATEPTQSAAPLIGLSREARLQRAVELGKFLATARPALVQEPSLQFPLVAAERKLGFANPAQRYFLSLESLPESDPWRRAADAEQWLAKPTENPPPKELARCVHFAPKPRLDGVLDESSWQTAEAIPVGRRTALPATSDDRAPASATTVRLARDSEFLYIGIQCDLVESMTYAVDEKPRPRDADLSTHDRVTLRFDTDRDFTTYFDLTIDDRGWTHDAAWSDTQWNPTWFVAAAHDATSWTIEAAIPLAELSLDVPQSRDVWAAGVRRTIPRQGEQSWPSDARGEDSPNQFGLLIFD